MYLISQKKKERFNGKLQFSELKNKQNIKKKKKKSPYQKNWSVSQIFQNTMFTI